MLSTPLSVMAALVLGEFSVESGWFSSEVMLAMAFVAIANYTQANYELGYALKFMRILNLILTQLFGNPCCLFRSMHRTNFPTKTDDKPHRNAEF